jgi:hypothetical protein
MLIKINKQKHNQRANQNDISNGQIKMIYITANLKSPTSSCSIALDLLLASSVVQYNTSSRTTIMSKMYMHLQYVYA